MAGGVVVLTTAVDGAFRAATISACLLTSVDPLQFLVSIEQDSQIDGWLSQSGFFGLSVLPWQQQFFADQFAGLTPLASPYFRGIEHFTAATGAPLLTQSIAWADCRVVAQLPTGDHRCYVGEALEVGRGEGDADDPLVYFLNRYRRLR
jgi:3-hydroxy-9,10-secoandrosta-1,3,5(10)-triene-9,17-dione monooxygenase reductase component